MILAGKGKPINPAARQLFKPTETIRIKNAEPTLEGLVHALYAGCSDAAVQYTEMDAPPVDYPPQADFNVGETIEVDTTEKEPPTISEMGQAAAILGEFVALPSYTESQVKCVEQATRGQAMNNDWMRHRLGRITASTIQSFPAEALFPSILVIFLFSLNNFNHLPLLSEQFWLFPSSP